MTIVMKTSNIAVKTANRTGDAPPTTAGAMGRFKSTFEGEVVLEAIDVVEAREIDTVGEVELEELGSDEVGLDGTDVKELEAAEEEELEEVDSDEVGLEGKDVKEVADEAEPEAAVEEEIEEMDSDEVLVEGLDVTKVRLEGMAIDTAVLKDVNLVKVALATMEEYVVLWLEVILADDARLLFALTVCEDIVDGDEVGWGDGSGCGEGAT